MAGAMRRRATIHWAMRRHSCCQGARAHEQRQVHARCHRRGHLAGPACRRDAPPPRIRSQGTVSSSRPARAKSGRAPWRGRWPRPAPRKSPFGQCSCRGTGAHDVEIIGPRQVQNCLVPAAKPIVDGAPAGRSPAGWRPPRLAHLGTGSPRARMLCPCMMRRRAAISSAKFSGVAARVASTMREGAASRSTGAPAMTRRAT